MVGLAAILLLVLCITTRRYRNKDPNNTQPGYFTKTRNNWHRKRRDKNLCKQDRGNLSKLSKDSSPTELTDLGPSTSGPSSSCLSSSPEPCDDQDIEISDNRILAGVRAARQMQRQVEESLQKPDTVDFDIQPESDPGDFII